MPNKQVYVGKKLVRIATKTAIAVAWTIIVASCAQMIDGPKPTVQQPVQEQENQMHHEGTGILIQHNDQEYVITTLHLARPCEFEPLIDIFGQWSTSTWKTIGIDEQNDVAVLQRIGANDSKIARLAARYGSEGTVLGSFAVALGFPGITPPVKWIRQAGKLRPVPMPVLTTIYFGAEDSYYSGGYLNYGFSGGPIVAWAGNHPTITGLVTQKATALRPDGILEHAGLVRIAAIGVAERIIAQHNNQTTDEFRAGKPKTDSYTQTQWSPASMMTAEIIDAVIRLACFGG